MQLRNVRLNMRYLVLVCMMVLVGTAGCGGPEAGRTEAARRPPNVLFIAVDDLRPQFGAYGDSIVQAPNLDRLAAEGILFRRAYCSVPVCGASRASLLTGLRPTPTRFLDFDVRVDEEAPHVVNLPAQFRANGYHTVSLGKVYHHTNDAASDWSEPAWHPAADPATAGASPHDYLLPENIAMDTLEGRRGPPFERAVVPDSAYYDGRIAARAVRTLDRLQGQDAPFFLAVGFLKPHLPFNAPAPYWDAYPPEAINIPALRDLPEGAPEEARHNWGELRNYDGIPPEGPVSDETARRLIQGYYASVSYVDAQVGIVLDALDRLGLREETIVVLWGDHGWSLGEHGLWCKHSPFHVALHAPLLVRAPDFEGGRAIDALTEFVDVYPSLLDLAGLPAPPHLAGTSFVPQMRDPDAPGKDAAFSRWHRAESIRTDRYLFTEWYDAQGAPAARMLYDHQDDPAETVNLAGRPEQAERVADLSARLRRLAAQSAATEE